MLACAGKTQLIRTGTKTEADFAHFDIFKTFAAEKPPPKKEEEGKKPKKKTAREKAILASLERTIAADERKLDGMLAAKGTFFFFLLCGVGCLVVWLFVCWWW